MQRNRVVPLIVLAFLLTVLAQAVMGVKLGGDFLCFWSAAKLMASGQSPYDPAQQTAIQVALGWDRAGMGYGLWDYLPYFYPPWLGMIIIPSIPLGYQGAKFCWVLLNVFSLLLAGELSRDVVPRLPGWAAPLVACLFLPSIIAVCLGQTSPLVVFGMSLAWWCLRSDRDRCAGVTLAWLTVKPQITFLMLGAVLLWSIRQRRWKVLQGFTIAFTILVVGSALVVPMWPWKMWTAITNSPVPTEAYPEIGGTWPLVLRTFGLRGVGLYSLWAILALPALGLLGIATWDRRGTSGDVLALGAIAAFFVAPYGRLYDYCVLLVPILSVASGARGGRILGLTVATTWMFMIVFALVLDDWPLLPGERVKLYTFFVVPVLVTVTWVVERMKQASLESAKISAAT